MYPTPKVQFCFQIFYSRQSNILHGHVSVISVTLCNSAGLAKDRTFILRCTNCTDAECRITIGDHGWEKDGIVILGKPGLSSRIAHLSSQCDDTQENSYDKDEDSYDCDS